MDPVSVSIGALGLVENLDKLIRLYRYNELSVREELDDVFGELLILQSVLVESKVMIDELLIRPPSLSIALKRCQELEKELAKILQRTGLDGEAMGKLKKAARLVFNEDKLRKIVTAFKSSVLLFRDIATDSLTHHMLRAVSGTNTTINGDLYINNKVSTIPTTAPSSGIKSGPQEHQQDPLLSKPLEKSSLFDATISFIADADTSKLPETVRRNLESPCACGRQRMGVWFPVRGKFDCGSNTDFVSEDVIKRAGLDSFVYETEDVVNLRIFGVTFDFRKKIALNWQLNNHENSYTRDFWVAPEADNFDLIIGEPWLMEHGYEIIQNHQSRKKTSFFGFFNLRLASSSKARAKAEKNTATENRNEAKDQLKQARLAVLTPQPTPAGSIVATGSTSTGSNTPNTSASRVPIPPAAANVP